MTLLRRRTCRSRWRRRDPIVDNDIVGVRQAGGTAFGIFDSAENGVVLANRVTDTDIGLILSATTKYRDNLTTGVTTPYIGGVDAGNNN